MKILYVEDELAQNLERVLKLFGQTVLSAKQLAQLGAFSNRECLCSYFYDFGIYSFTFLLFTHLLKQSPITVGFYATHFQY